MEPYQLDELWVSPVLKDIKENGEGSKVFEVGERKWRLILFPKGYKESVGKSVALFVMSPKLDVQHAVFVDVGTEGGKEVVSKQFNFSFSNVVQNRGIFDFIPLDSVEDYLDADGKFRIRLKIKFNPQMGRNARGETGYVGLLNSGATCYMNSVLQCLFHTPEFRRIVFSIATDGCQDEGKSVALNLQRLFCLLQIAPVAPGTQALTESFGWGPLDVFMQHDVQEFLCVLLDNIEAKMKGSENGEAIASLFRGKTEAFIKCVSHDYMSSHAESFYDLQMMVKGKKGLIESLEYFIEDDLMDGENQYMVEGHGKEDAIKGCRFTELPPVLHLHVNRMAYDVRYGQMMKINDQWTFPFELDMEPYLSVTADSEVDYTYELTSVLVHIGDRYGGHYIAYCRTTAERRWFCFDDNTVREVSERDAIDNNFGGPRVSHSAYFLVYTRKSDMEKIMKPIDRSELSSQLINYCHQWQHDSGIGPAKVDMDIWTDADIASVYGFYGFSAVDANRNTASMEVPGSNRFEDIESPVKTRCGLNTDANCSFWRIDLRNGLGMSYLNEKNVLGNVMGAGQRLDVYIGPDRAQIDEMAVPICVAFYDPSVVTKAIQYVKFATVLADDTFEEVAAEVAEKYSTSVDQLSAFSLAAKVIEIDIQKTLASQNIRSGTICFQVRKPSLVKQAFSDLRCFRSIDFIPEQACDSVITFLDSASRSLLLTVCSLTEPDVVMFKVSVMESNPVTTLFRVLRGILKLDDDEGILLFRHENGKPADQPINAYVRVSIAQVLSRRVYIQRMKGNSQEEIDSKKLIRLSVHDADLEVLARPSLLMPASFLASDVVNKLTSAGVVNVSEERMRLLHLSGARIVKRLDMNDNISGLTGTFRLEIIPDDQIGLPQNELVRVLLTRNKVIPRDDSFGVPFIFRVIPGELWKDTRERLIAISHVDAKARFGYTISSTSRRDYTRIDDDSLVLSECLSGDATMLYIFVEGRVTRGGNLFNGGISIYN